MILKRETCCMVRQLLLFYVIWMWAAAPALQLRTSMELDSSLLPGAEPLYSSENRPAFMLSFRFSTPNIYLCISFVLNQSEAGQCVWTANREYAVTGSASLTLSSSGNLRLSDPSLASSHPNILNSNTSGLRVVRALLLNSGNLVLVNSTGSYVWQSFHYPTDTLLPGQQFTPQSGRLFSNRRLADFSSGRYSLNFVESEGIVLSRVADSTTYWKEWGNVSSFVFDQLGNITTLSNSTRFTFVTTDHGSSAPRRMTLDMDGNLRVYAWDEALAQWNIVWMAVTNVCSQVVGVCGTVGVCTLNPTQPTCMCPQGFSIVDRTDLYSGCRLNYEIKNCTSNIKYSEVTNVDYPQNDYLNFSAISAEECKLHCSSYCDCMIAVYLQSIRFNGLCYLKPHANNGRNTGTQVHRVFYKLSASDPLVPDTVVITATQWSSQDLLQPSRAITSSSNQSLPTPDITYIKSNKGSEVIVALAVVIAIQAVLLAGAVAAFIRRHRRQLRYMKLHGQLEGSPQVCSYEELRVATQSFSQKLGEGGFGTVYKGQLNNGKLVAVKKLEGIAQQEKQFRAEIITIGRIHHINLLRLVGFCSEGIHRLLVYEYMEMGSLDQTLFEKEVPDKQNIDKLADWGTRFQICLGVARGLHYLHEECLDCILHCDIKPQNILLDGSFCAKVADFGLAYLYSRDHTVKMTTIRGTRGYLAPEWVSNRPITSKADVYSYGMLIMEIVSGRRNYLYTESALMETNDKWCFPVWAYGKSMKDVADARLDALSIDWIQVETVVKVAFACIQADMIARPTMGKVVQMLEGTLAVPHAPPPDQPYPAFSGSSPSSSQARPYATFSDTAASSNVTMSGRVPPYLKLI